MKGVEAEGKNRPSLFALTFFLRLSHPMNKSYESNFLATAPWRNTQKLLWFLFDAAHCTIKAKTFYWARKVFPTSKHITRSFVFSGFS